jgi:expansin (peptidoglycan-binding protein)
LPQYYAALNTEDYAGAAMCGACLRVTGPSGASLDVQIVDECPYQGNEQWCYPGSHHVDLNQAAFSQLANLSQGVMDISWQVVSCDVQGNLSFIFKQGSSKYWTAILVRNHPQPIDKVEYSSQTSGGYRELRREAYNYWIADNGFGDGPYSIRISDATGAVVEQTGLATLGGSELGSDMPVSGSVQLAKCP